MNTPREDSVLEGPKAYRIWIALFKENNVQLFIQNYECLPRSTEGVQSLTFIIFTVSLPWIEHMWFTQHPVIAPLSPSSLSSFIFFLSFFLEYH